MPVYEFLCNACQKSFAKILMIAEHKNDKIVCPHCGSDNVQQEWTSFCAITSKKAAKWIAPKLSKDGLQIFKDSAG